jgi:hypothetical protein
LLTRIRDRAKERQVARLSSYSDLVALVANAQSGPSEVDPDEVAEHLERLGKGADDLDQDVAVVLQRRELAAKIELAKTVPDELAEIDKKLQESARRLEAAQKKHEETAVPLIQRRKALEQIQFEAREAQGRLLVPPTEDLAKERSEAERANAEIGGRIRKLQSHRAEVAIRLEQLEGEFARMPEGGLLYERKATDVRSCRERLTQIDRQMVDLQAEAGAVSERVGQVNQKILAWNR